jgi:hypothetical protein
MITKDPTEFYMSDTDRSRRNNMQMLERKQEAIHCRCGYTWNTKSQLGYVTCPSCRHLNHRGTGGIIDTK